MLVTTITLKVILFWVFAMIPAVLPLPKIFLETIFLPACWKQRVTLLDFPPPSGIFAPSVLFSVLKTRKSHRVEDLENMEDGASESCCYWLKTVESEGQLGLMHCRSGEAMYCSAIYTIYVRIFHIRRDVLCITQIELSISDQFCTQTVLHLSKFCLSSLWYGLHFHAKRSGK